MANFTVRVVLHDATAKNYTDLHAAMAKSLSAARSIKSTDGVWYDLPDGEYDIASAKTPGELCDAVLAVAVGIKATPRPSVLVTQANGRSWRLLKVPGQS